MGRDRTLPGDIFRDTMKLPGVVGRAVALAWMAPRFSMSCSGVDDPRSTELTPSFLRHHAGKREHWVRGSKFY